MRTLIAALAILALAPSAVATAATKPVGPVFGLRAVGNPKLGYFVYPVSAGTTLQGGVTVTNTGDRTGTVKLYSADATTGATTGTVYLTDSAPKGVGTWISVGASSLTLAPGAHKMVPFTVHVPAASKAGQYVGGIVAETKRQATGPKSAHKTNVQITVRNLSIVAVEVDVPGTQVARFAIGGVTAGGSQGRQQIFIHFSNEGNVLRKPGGSVTIRTAAGARIQKIKIHMDTFLPHTAIDYPVQLSKALAAGNYVASIELTYAGTGTAGTEMSSAAPAFSVSNQSVQKVFNPGKPTQVGPGGVVAASKSSSNLWEYLAIGLGALVLASGGYFFAVFRRRPVTVAATPIPPSPPATAPPPAAAPVPERCEGYHYWQVDWDRPETGLDGRVTYPHRCQRCGIEVRATDIADAATQAGEAGL